MPDTSKHDILCFESPSIRGLHDSMNAWQLDSDRHLSSVGIQRDGSTFCATALAGPVEITVTSSDGRKHAIVSENGRLFVYPSDYS